MPHTLIIRHTDALEFVVARADGKLATPVTLTAPDAVTVEGRGDSHLLQDLGWYLERFLVYPFPPNTELAERIQAALAEWGQACFAQLFAGQALLWYDRARQEGLEQLTLKVASDDPRVLGWPWEALADPHGTTLAHNCRIERQLSALHDPLALPEQLPEDRINILLIIARPYGDEDVGYHALARPLVEQVQAKRLPVHIEVLRPPTFKELEARLRQRPGFYHIVHFDGHGGYGEVAHGEVAQGEPTDRASPHVLKGRTEGRLIFETPEGEDNPVSAAKLTALLSEHRIPIMVLNACQSARIDERADDPFASVAAALLKAGMRSVVAMGYNLYVSAAQQFVPAFYERLLESGEVAEATRAGRRAMREQEQRVCARGEHPLQDWLVPVLYQQEPLVLPVAALTPIAKEANRLPQEARALGDYGFIGRQRAIQALERAVLAQPQAGLLIHGMAGVGKTTLAMGYLQWLEQTNGLGTAEPGGRFVDALWFGFDDIRGFEHVVNRLVEALFGHGATAAPLEQKLPALTQGLRETPLLLVWDNFESAAGIDGTEVQPLLTEEDRARLKGLLKALRGGRSKVLITSRARESWLAPQEAYRLPLGGLQGEERWAYCNAVVADLGLRIARDDPQYAELIEALDGHPLAMRAVLLRLAESSAERLLAELKTAFAGAEGDESTRRIFAALELLDRGLSEDFAPVLALIGLHRRYVDIDSLEEMAQRAGSPVARTRLEACFAALEAGGLLHPELDHGVSGIYRQHPALSGFLASRHPADEGLQRGFVDVLGTLADELTLKPLPQQRWPFAIHGASFHQALALAADLGMDTHVAALTQSLAAFALNRRDLAGAGRLYEALAAHAQAIDGQKGLGSAYHNLGRIAYEQREFARAEAWYQKALAISEKQGNEHGAASTYHQLGMIAKEQREFARAEAWYQKSLAIFEKQGDEHGAAGIYHNLGVIAQEQWDFARAEAWYQKALAIKEKQGDEHGAAGIYHNLGVIADEQRDFARAEAWYQKALAIHEKQGNEHGAAQTYHQLGSVALEQREFARAEAWYQKALAIKEKQGNEHGAARTYGQLGNMALRQGEFARAEAWCQKSLAIFEEQGNEHLAASTYHLLGTIAQEQRDFARAEVWYQKALAIFEKQGNEHGAAITYHQLGRIAEAQREFARAEVWYQKALAIFEKQGDEHGAAITYGQFGNMALEQGDFAGAGAWLLQAVAGFAKANDRHYLGFAIRLYVRTLRAADAPTQADLRQRWQGADLDRITTLDEAERKLDEQERHD